MPNIRAIKVSGSNAATAASSGPGGGGFTIPGAPNIDATWLSGVTTYTQTVQRRGSLNGSVLIGYMGVITPPVGADTSNLKAIHITRIIRTDSDERRLMLTINGPFTVGVGKDFKSHAVDLANTSGVYLEFACEGPNGITPNPYTVAISTLVEVGNPQLVFVNASEISPRYQTPDRGLVIQLGFTPLISPALYPVTITVWTTRPARGNESGPVTEWRGWWILEGPGIQYIGKPGTPSQYMVWPPTVNDEYWTITCAIGSIGSNEDPFAQAYVTSAPFFVASPAIPPVGGYDGSGGAYGAYIDRVIIGTTTGRGRVKSGMWGWDNLYVNLPLHEPEFVTARWTVQNGYYATPGNPATFTTNADGQHGGEEKQFTDLDDAMVDQLQGTDLVSISNPSLWTIPDYYLADGTLNPNNVFRFKIYIESRNNADGTGGAWTLQHCWSSAPGVSTQGTNAWQDVVLDLSSARPSGKQFAGNLPNGMHKFPGTTIPIDGSGLLGLDAFDALKVFQNLFDIGQQAGSIPHGRVNNLSSFDVFNFTNNDNIQTVTGGRGLSTLDVTTRFLNGPDITRKSQLNTINAETAFLNSNNLQTRTGPTGLATVPLDTFLGYIQNWRISDLGSYNVYAFANGASVMNVNNMLNYNVYGFGNGGSVMNVNNVGNYNVYAFANGGSVMNINSVGSYNVYAFQNGGTIMNINTQASYQINLFGGQLNVITQLSPSNPIPTDRIATIYVSTLRGWGNADINIESGLSFSGLGDLKMYNGGGIKVNPGNIWTTGYFKVGPFGSLVIAPDASGNFAYLQIQGGTKIDSSGNFYANNLTISTGATYLGSAGQTGSVTLATPGGGSVTLWFQAGGIVAGL